MAFFCTPRVKMKASGITLAVFIGELVWILSHSAKKVPCNYKVQLSALGM